MTETNYGLKEFGTFKPIPSKKDFIWVTRYTTCPFSVSLHSPLPVLVRSSGVPKLGSLGNEHGFFSLLRKIRNWKRTVETINYWSQRNPVQGTVSLRLSQTGPRWSLRERNIVLDSDTLWVDPSDSYYVCRSGAEVSTTESSRTRVESLVQRWRVRRLRPL